MKRDLDPSFVAATEIIGLLRGAGHTALLAGGCVRDRLLGLAPKDYDVATDATPGRILELFPRARRVGMAFGVILVRRHGSDVEVATFRADGPYSDGRHPDEIRFGSAVEDARRRDFTINGLFLDPADGKVIDHVGGADDLQAKVIRTIGDAAVRFAEDHLRLIRAVRFSARLGFEIEGHTWAAMSAVAQNLRTISPERVWQELERMLTHPSRARAWQLLVRSGLRAHLCPEWPADDVDDELVRNRLADLPDRETDSALALSSTLATRSPEVVRAVCRGLRLSNDLSQSIAWLVQSLRTIRNPDALELADLKQLMARREWTALPALFLADLRAKGDPETAYQALVDRSSAIHSEEVSPPPLLNGDDLLQIGFPAGPQLGRVLEAVYRAQRNETIRTTEEALLEARRVFGM